MANVSKRTNKDGSVAYRIRVFSGRKADGTQLKAYQTTWKPDPNKSERANAKALNEFAVKFEADCKAGTIATERRKFGEYGRYIVQLKYKNGELKNSTMERDINTFTHLKELDGIMLEKITPQMLSNLYEKLLDTPLLNSQRYILRRKIDPLRLTNCSSKAAFSKKYGIAGTTLRAVLNGDNVTCRTAEKIVAALGMPVSALFTTESTGETLSPKTVTRIHALISMILNEAVKDGIISANPAERARLPKVEKHEAEFLEPEELAAVLAAADNEPPKVRLFIYLLAASGGRRGEVAGLRWQNVNFMFNQIHFEQTVLYRKNLGMYTDTPKNEKSNRFLKLPPEMMKMLSEYKRECEQVREKCGTAYPDKIKLPDGNGKVNELETDFVFTQSRKLGYPINPDTPNGWLRKLYVKYDLAKLYPHKFRHSAASTLIFAGNDVVSVAAYLGHSSPAVTEKIYAHALQEAQNRNAEAIGAVMFQRKPAPADNVNNADTNMKSG